MPLIQVDSGRATFSSVCTQPKLGAQKNCKSAGSFPSNASGIGHFTGWCQVLELASEHLSTFNVDVPSKT